TPSTSRCPAPPRTHPARPAPTPEHRPEPPRPAGGPRTTRPRSLRPATGLALPASVAPRGHGSPGRSPPRPRAAPPPVPSPARARPVSARPPSPALPGELQGNPGVRRAALDDAEQPALHVLLEVRARAVRLKRLLVVVLLVEEEAARLLTAAMHLVHPAARLLEAGLGQLGEELDRLVFPVGQHDVGDGHADHRSAPLRNRSREASPRFGATSQ